MSIGSGGLRTTLALANFVWIKLVLHVIISMWILRHLVGVLSSTRSSLSLSVTIGTSYHYLILGSKRFVIRAHWSSIHVRITCKVIHQCLFWGCSWSDYVLFVFGSWVTLLVHANNDVSLRTRVIMLIYSLLLSWLNTWVSVSIPSQTMTLFEHRPSILWSCALSLHFKLLAILVDYISKSAVLLTIMLHIQVII